MLQASEREMRFSEDMRRTSRGNGDAMEDASKLRTSKERIKELGKPAAGSMPSVEKTTWTGSLVENVRLRSFNSNPWKCLRH